MSKIREIILKEGEAIRIRGKLSVYCPYKKKNGIWIGGSSWTAKNPILTLGKCKHIRQVKLKSFNNLFGGKFRFKKGKEEIRCVDCSKCLKMGDELSHSS